MRLRLLGPDARASVEPVWRALHARLDPRGIPTSWEWTSAWLEQWGESVDHWFALAERGDHLAGAALVTRETPPVSVLRGRALHLGTAGEPACDAVFVEHNRLLCEPAELSAFGRALMETARGISGWDRLALDGFRPEDAAALRAAAPDLTLRLERAPCRDLAAVRASGGDMHAALRSGVRRRVRQSERHFTDLRTLWAQTPQDALATLEDLMALHEARWALEGKTGAFAGERARNFHRTLIERLLPLDRVALVRVTAGGETIGCLYCHLDDDAVLFYQSGFAQFEDNRLRPGLVTHVAAMQECVERGFALYDFMAGEARYKDELSDTERQLAWGTLERATPRALLSRTARAAWAQFRRRRPAE